MPEYSDFIDRLLLRPKILSKLRPSEPLEWDLPARIREANDQTLLGEREIKAPAAVSLVRGGLLYAVDALDPAHRHFQDDPSDLASYWHGMMHRREGDFDNARYWFRRAGRQPFFDRLHGVSAEHSPVMARQLTWDPYLFTGECEHARFGAENGEELSKLQRAEFDVAFDYTWRQAV